MKYRRIIATGYGTPEVLEMIEDTLLSPGPGEITIRVEAAGVAFGEIIRRQAPIPGFPPPPYTPGYDVVGYVHAVGERVLSVSVGERVIAFALSLDFTRGGYAEYVTVPAYRAVSIPKSLDAAEAAALVLNYITAYQVLHRGAMVTEGETVLIHGAGGGVGTALLQLGQLSNLTMYGTASAAKHDIIRSLGGIPIDYRSTDFVEVIRQSTTNGTVDAVLDGIGGDYVDRSYPLLGSNGRMIVYGFTSMAPNQFEDQLMDEINRIEAFDQREEAKHVVVLGVDIDGQPEAYRTDLSRLVDLLTEGKIKPVIAERLPFQEVRKAHILLQDHAVAGRIVLLMDMQ